LIDRYGQVRGNNLAKTSYVLRALTILGLEEMLKLSEVLSVKQVPFKKVAGEELIVWNDDDPLPDRPSGQADEDAKILVFTKQKNVNEVASSYDLNPAKAEEKEKKGREDETVPHVITSDLILWQREMSRESGEAIQKLGAVKGYQRSNEMYVVKSLTPEGKEKIRFATTNGILVNKKQA